LSRYLIEIYLYRMRHSRSWDYRELRFLRCQWRNIFWMSWIYRSSVISLNRVSTLRWRSMSLINALKSRYVAPKSLTMDISHIISGDDIKRGIPLHTQLTKKTPKQSVWYTSSSIVLKV
jgi:hypothetical protein